MASSLTLYPVILSIPESLMDGLPGSERLAVQRKMSREALAFSARKSGLPLGAIEKDKRGAPLPSNGVYWSLSHKTKCVAAVVSTRGIGIDVEEVKDRTSRQLFEYLAGPEEWQLFSPSLPDWEIFYRCWTAKEAAIKATGEGLKDLRKCKVVTIPDTDHLILFYDHRFWTVEHHRWQNHLISVTAEDDDQTIEWITDPMP
jgi:4'-phosphopantetheinyl transferase